jgi:hypothetical protein
VDGRTDGLDFFLVDVDAGVLIHPFIHSFVREFVSSYHG